MTHNGHPPERYFWREQIEKIRQRATQLRFSRRPETAPSRCEQCGNDYDKSFEVRMAGRTMIFDSFECAIQALAPTCPHCGCRIIGHGVEHDGTIFCCVHCAKKEGVTGLRDRD